jgi:hypothetical protein
MSGPSGFADKQKLYFTMFIIVCWELFTAVTYPHPITVARSHPEKRSKHLPHMLVSKNIGYSGTPINWLIPIFGSFSPVLMFESDV